MQELYKIKSKRLILPESTQEELERLGVKPVEGFEAAPLPPTPSSYSIRNEMTPVKDQGGQGSCTAFCVVANLEYVANGRILSEGQVQHEAETSHGDCEEGLAMVHAYETCRSPGAVPLTAWPYDDAQVCWTSPPNVSSEQRSRFASFGYVYRRDRAALIKGMRSDDGSAQLPGLPLTVQIQRQLFARRKPVSVSVPVVWSAWPWTGEITMPPTSDIRPFAAEAAPPNTEGWHCISVTGWNNSTGRFEFKNSWGTFWGDRGYGTIPYQYIDFYSDLAIVGW